MTDPTLRQVTQEVDDALEKAVSRELLARGGFWHRRFRGNALPSRGRRLLVWTGHMIRPRPGIWLLVGGAFNRRSRVAVVDHLVTDPDRFVPLVVEIDTRDITREPRWLEMELGCVTPLRPAARMRKQRLAAGAPELREFAAFFSDAYFETKAKHPTGTYVVRQRERAKSRAKADTHCDARLLYIGPDVHTVRPFGRFITAGGFSAKAASPGTLEAAVVNNIAPTRWTWQGQTHSSFEVRKRHLPELRAIWRKTFGAGGQPSALEFLEGHLIGESWDQPYVQLQPWAFAPTAAGWSTLVDGFHQYPATTACARSSPPTGSRRWRWCTGSMIRRRCASLTARRCCGRSRYTAPRWRWAPGIDDLEELPLTCRVGLCILEYQLPTKFNCSEVI